MFFFLNFACRCLLAGAVEAPAGPSTAVSRRWVLLVGVCCALASRSFTPDLFNYNICDTFIVFLI